MEEDDFVMVAQVCVLLQDADAQGHLFQWPFSQPGRFRNIGAQLSSTMKNEIK
jgi:hypothetical protein